MADPRSNFVLKGGMLFGTAVGESGLSQSYFVYSGRQPVTLLDCGRCQEAPFGEGLSELHFKYNHFSKKDAVYAVL